MAENPYSSLPDHRFWRKAVTGTPPFAIDPVLETPFRIAPHDRVATGGSCFAQEIAQRLQKSGFLYYLAEQPPEGMSAAEALRRNYAMYSCRYGNLYTTLQFRQLIDRAYGRFQPQIDVWTHAKTGRYLDPFRPRIEPDGWATADDMRADREKHLAAVRNMLETMDVFVFTFGHTETWRHKPDGAIMQMAPGVDGGTWDPDTYEFYNMTVSEVVREFLACVDMIRDVNPNVRIVLSVSPVGIIATYENRHVIESNSAVKAILRAAADEVVRSRPNIAYFPSFDLATASPNVSRFYREDTRRITEAGIDQTMRIFFKHLTTQGSTAPDIPSMSVDVAAEAAGNSRIVCDEEAIESA